MFKRKQREIKIESMRAGLDFLDALQMRHLGWVEDTNDSEITRIHTEIIDLIQQTRNRYNRLLALYTQRHE